MAIDPMPKQSPEAKKAGGLRERRLQALPHWPAIELRLRAGWSPDRVVRWHKAQWPGDPAPAARTLWRYLRDKGPDWFLPPLDEAETGRPRLPHVLALERHAELTELQLRRVAQFIKLEKGTEAGGFGLPIPEVRANIELAERMLEKQLRMQQEVGLEPRVTAGDRAEEDRRGGAPDELRELLARVTQLPPERFGPTLVALLGPPPVKQPPPPWMLIEAAADGQEANDGDQPEGLT